MISLSGFLRRLARDAVLAGVEDALRYLEPHPSHDVPSKLAEQLGDRLKRLNQERPTSATVANSSPPHHSQMQVAEQQKPSAHPTPERSTPDRQHQQPSILPPRKRGPGRPKKESQSRAH